MIGHEAVQMDPGTRCWVQVIDFELPPGMTDEEALSAMICSHGYHWDAASPYPPQPADDGVHGRWRLEALSARRFRPTTPAAARDLLMRWAHGSGAADCQVEPSVDALARLGRVLSLLDRGKVLRLDNPDDAQMHSYGWVTGEGGFHEFAILGRQRGCLHLLIASDD